MAYCINCGQELEEDAKFCANCGKAVEDNRSTSQRKTTYDGEIHKCPNCGSTLKAFETVCSACGTELRGARSSNAISALAEKLENATSEKQRIDIVKNFPIPNTREDIFEFMLLASCNFDSSYYVTHLHEEDISDAWLSKIEQCYSKAKLSFGSPLDFEKIESIYLKIKADCADKRRKVEFEEKARKKAQERAETEKGFKKSKLRIIIIIFSVISAMCVSVSFNDGKVLSGIIAIVMFASFVVAFLMGSGIIKEKVKNIRLLPLIFGFFLFVPFFAANNGNVSPAFTPNDFFDNKTYETLLWDEIVLGEMLPIPDSLKGEIVINSESELDLRLADATQSTFSAYIQLCKEKGFSIDNLQESNSFRAFNSDGYRIKLSFSDYYNELSIDLVDPVKRNSIKWSSVPLMRDVPKPPSSIGEYGNNYDWTVTIYLVDVTRERYDAYIDKCIEKGFSVDMSRYENTFYGNNKDGLELEISWEGNNIICVHVTDLELL